MICHASRWPNAQNGVAVVVPAARREASSSVASICGPMPSASWPSTRQPSPGAAPSVTLPQSSSTSTEPPAGGEGALTGREGGRPRVLAAGARRQRADPAAQEAADHQAERRGDDEPAEEVEPGPAQDQADADADEDERPERPQPSDLVVGQVARANGERDRAGQDQEDAPAEDSRAGCAWPLRYPTAVAGATAECHDLS